MEEKLRMVEQLLKSGLFDDMEEIMLLKDLELNIKQKLGEKEFSEVEDTDCESCSA